MHFTIVVVLNIECKHCKATFASKNKLYLYLRTINYRKLKIILKPESLNDLIPLIAAYLIVVELAALFK